jgi:hypothetical protein
MSDVGKSVKACSASRLPKMVVNKQSRQQHINSTAWNFVYAVIPLLP